MTTTKTRITELLGIKYPIFQGGMAWIAEHTLASAVSNAGGLGIIAGGSAPIDYLRDQIRQTKAAVNGKPFGVNIMLMSPNADDLAQLVIDEGVPVVTTGAGNPGKYMAAWQEAYLSFRQLLLQREWKEQALTLLLQREQSLADISVKTQPCVLYHR